MNEFDCDVRIAVYRHFVSECRAPGADEIAAVLNVDPEAIRLTFARLAVEHVLVLDSDSMEIRMAMPFSAVPTDYKVTIGEKSWWANGAWDALGVPAMLGGEAVVQTRCPVSDGPVHLNVNRNGLESGVGGVVHFAVPAARWWENIGYTGSTILYFRSEADVEVWCNTHNRPFGGVLSLETAWQLAKAWYHDRLDPAWRRKSAEEVQALFTNLGMTSTFWQL